MFVNSYFDMCMYFYVMWRYKSYSRYTRGHPLKTERKHHAPQKDSQVSSTDKLRH